jgi:signal transduction histidine kinase
MATVAVVAAVAAAVLLVLREMTWRERAGDLRGRIAELRMRLREHEDRAHVEQVVSGLAQELKSPLQGVIGNTELMLASGGLGQSSTADLREIQEHATRAAGIVRNLVAFTETSALTRRWQDVNALARRAIDGLRSEFGASGVTVDVSLADRLPLLYVDGRQLEKVIATLLSRRPEPADAASASLPITVATRRGESDERIIIEIDDRASATDEPVWSSDLAACRQIVQAHGGSLEVDRAARGGFKFHLELPVTAAAAAAPAPGA